jgi:UDP-GlcNAc:undecaprenyl-phosphate GlcNAc-1-phosphate transferase
MVFFPTDPLAEVRLTVALMAGATLVLVGILDDAHNINPFVRLAVYFGLCLVVMASGLTVGILQLSFIGLALTPLIILASINAVNLLDGMDGLASGVSAVACLPFAYVAYIQGDAFSLVLSLSLLGALLGFLPYNFHPARIFLGNSGSTLVGFMLALLIVAAASRSQSPWFLVACLLVLGLPFADTVLAIGRRIKNRKSIFEGDREHFYDRLRRRGMTQRQTALIAYVVSSAFGALGLIFMRLTG